MRGGPVRDVVEREMKAGLALKAIFHAQPLLVPQLLALLLPLAQHHSVSPRFFGLELLHGVEAGGSQLSRSLPAGFGKSMSAQRSIIAVLLANLFNVLGSLLVYGLHVLLKATFALEALQGREGDAEPCHHAAVGVLGEEFAETLLQFAFKIIFLHATFGVRAHGHLPLGCGGGLGRGLGIVETHYTFISVQNFIILRASCSS